MWEGAPGGAWDDRPLGLSKALRREQRPETVADAKRQRLVGDGKQNIEIVNVGVGVDQRKVRSKRASPVCGLTACKVKRRLEPRSRGRGVFSSVTTWSFKIW